MPTTFKVLGQTITTAASASIVKNLITDPTLDAVVKDSYTTTSTSYYTRSVSGTTIKVAGENTSWDASAATTYGVPVYSGANSLAFNNYSGGTQNASFLTGPENVSNIGQNGTGNMTASQAASGAITVTGNTTYYMGGYGYPEANTRTWNVGAKWYTSSGNYISIDTAAISCSGNAWTKLSHTATAPSTAAYAIFIIYGPIGAGQRAIVDNLWFSTDSSANTTNPIPVASSDTDLLTAPFTSRGTFVWSGTVNNSTTITAYAGALTDLYTVPSSTQAVVSTVTISNLSLTSGKIRLLVLPSGQTAAKKNFIVFDAPIGANSTEAFTLGITLNAGDKLQVASDTANVSATAFGSEIS